MKHVLAYLRRSRLVLILWGALVHSSVFGAVTFDWGGFISQGYLASDNYNFLVVDTQDGGTFDYTEIALNGSVSPFARTSINAQVFAYELGPVGNYSPFIDYAFVDYEAKREIGVRLGRIRRPQGFYNEVVDIDVARQWALLPQGVYSAGFRDFWASLDGAALYGSIDIGTDFIFEYTVYYGIMEAGTEDSALDIAVGEPLVNNFGAANPQEFISNTTYGGQFWLMPFMADWRVGFGFAVIDDVELRYELPLLQTGFIQEGTFTTFQISGEYYAGPWHLQAELYFLEDVSERSIIGMGPIGDTDLLMASWYVGASRPINDDWSGGFYYSESYDDWNNKYGDGRGGERYRYYTRDLAGSLRYTHNENLSVKFELHGLEGNSLGRFYTAQPDWSSRYWWLFTSKVTLVF